MIRASVVLLGEGDWFEVVSDYFLSLDYQCVQSYSCQGIWDLDCTVLVLSFDLSGWRHSGGPVSEDGPERCGEHSSSSFQDYHRNDGTVIK